ncbi:hypothetical protein M440DRAFT_136770 [Trichoderma longibrachiatum ATCC 18648]|uniref:Uncharacterized protein n=1 Tax=Trichoderma longibrachiatum ATCC 18648 TaxID=983965 RepID=A0A2T4BWI8_TRILO|nr:hypothetical protein M440DRAFT_136770 [Trichoderma longibrachiatum ATCC 18648]
MFNDEINCERDCKCLMNLFWVCIVLHSTVVRAQVTSARICSVLCLPFFHHFTRSSHVIRSHLRIQLSNTTILYSHRTSSVHALLTRSAHWHGTRGHPSANVCRGTVPTRSASKPGGGCCAGTGPGTTSPMQSAPEAKSPRPVTILALTAPD